MAEVAKLATRATELEALAALARAFVHVFGRRPTVAELAMLWAQSAHETNGWAAMPNWNPAGIKAGAGYAGDWRIAMTTEGHGANAKRVPQRFRAYASLELGMRDWLDVLRRGYPLALEGARTGMVSAFVAGLLEGWGRGADYFTGDPRAYERDAAVWFDRLAAMPIAWADLCGSDLATVLRGEGTGEG